MDLWYATEGILCIYAVEGIYCIPERVIDTIAAGVKHQAQAFIATAPPAPAE
jgi:hypothetical protein